MCLRRPSLANGGDLFSKVFYAEQIEQIQNALQNTSVLTFAQVKTGKSLFRTDRTDICGLTSRVEIRGVSPGRLSPGGVCGAHMEKSVLSVLTCLAVKFCGAVRRSGGLAGR
ncbi:hypothetical protein SEA_TINIBUG_70 [Mycobacterium Phage TiniBug]|nr:hypothetical protein SEA_TINIBUG_70 [Mycobacterium Phage TiniBug]